MHIGSGNTSLSTITLMRLLEHMTNAQRREWLTDGGVNLFAQVYNTNACNNETPQMVALIREALHDFVSLSNAQIATPNCPENPRSYRPRTFLIRNIPPKDNMDGGKPGSNIRVAYLYVTELLSLLCSMLHLFSRWNPNKVSLLPGHVAGSATQDTTVVQSDDGEITLR